MGASLAYLVDVPLEANGKVPKLKQREMLLFADAVPGRAGELQLVAPGAQLAFTPELETRLRPILTELYGAEVPPRITGISDALAVCDKYGLQKPKVEQPQYSISRLVIGQAAPGKTPVPGSGEAERRDFALHHRHPLIGGEHRILRGIGGDPVDQAGFGQFGKLFGIGGIEEYLHAPGLSGFGSALRGGVILPCARQG